MTTFVIKYNNKYLKFGSYSKATPVDNPTKASLYSQQRLAKTRISNHWIDGVEVKAKDLELVELTFKLVKERKL